MADRVLLQFHVKRYGRGNSKEVLVSRSDWDPSVTRWLWPAMEQYEKDTSLSPAHYTDWDSLSQALPGLAKVPRWAAFTSIPVDSLEVEHVRDLFIDIDDAFHRMWGSDRGALRSSKVRKFLSNHLLRLRPDGMLLRVKGSFRPKGRADHQPRALISDQVRSGTNDSERAPLGAMPHTNIAELKARQSKRLKEDLQAVEDACCQELDAYYSACKALDAYATQTVEGDLQQEVLGKLSQIRERINVHLQAFSADERRALVAHYYRVDNAQDAQFETPDYRGGEVLAGGLTELMRIQPLTFLRCLRYRFYPAQTVLVAAMVLIQLKTAWNIGSVVELKSGRVQRLSGGGYLIQSSKSKTGDDTPMVLLEGSDNSGARALQFALDRLSALKARGWADSAEQCLWLSPRSNYDGSRGLPIANLASGLKRLREKYSLFYFTFDQLRTQKLTLVSIDEGPIAAAELAGHSSFATIGGYIDHLMTRRINSSVNLEFQKRWEAEVAALIETGPTANALMPVGDGSSCLNPAEPPNDEWLRAGVCDAASCHSGNGCPNRKLVIDRDRVEEAILTRRYYGANWRRLLAANPHAFASLHMPRMEFNMYLHEYLKKGPYRHLING